ncbi:hypothetical protein GRX01_10725 [Halobaculum sp. WSA2]|uniref:Fructosamine kinase n=1 Tax=Halobaculum saliterrae TaxID=2073113 RepID=A0A6B0STC1_9EURY|nr:hypothetical protein [Halobaculum saliterrae]
MAGDDAESRPGTGTATREHTGVADGYREREPAYRLYPLLTHLRYFGGGYLDEVRTTLSALGY